MLSFRTPSRQQEEVHPKGICPGDELTFCESMEVEQGREMLLDWKHQVSSPALAQSSWHHSIQSSWQVHLGNAVLAHGL